MKKYQFYYATSFSINAFAFQHHKFYPLYNDLYKFFEYWIKQTIKKSQYLTKTFNKKLFCEMLHLQIKQIFELFASYNATEHNSLHDAFNDQIFDICEKMPINDTGLNHLLYIGEDSFVWENLIRIQSKYKDFYEDVQFFLFEEMLRKMSIKKQNKFFDDLDEWVKNKKNEKVLVS